MTEIRSGALKFKGSPVNVVGPELKVGDKAPANFTLVANDMAELRGADLAGKPRILVAVPSLDTPVCDLETRRFNEEAVKIPGVQVYTVSVDLPFAQKRWCGNAGVERVQTLSDFRARDFGPAHGAWLPSLGLLARAVFVVDATDTVRHVEYVAEVTSEPDYAAAIAAARALA
jgi:thiol peroxidase